MRFTKLHSLGNDFLVNCRGEEIPADHLPEFVRRICDRHTGVGADGFLIVRPVHGSREEFDFRIFNADGSEAEISGNGLRCALACMIHHGGAGHGRVLFRTSAGDRTCEPVESAGRRFVIKIQMGTPRLDSDSIPFDDGQAHERIIDYPLSINRRVHEITCVSMGNAHCDIFVERFPARIEWHQVGAEIESHPFFPKRTNVEFVRVVDRGRIEVLFWERGVGETMSSGTGSCAAAVAAMLKGLTDRTVQVETSLGTFTVEWPPDGPVYQTGPAEVVFEGDYLAEP